MKMRKDKDFISFFDAAAGHYVRSGIIKNGVESAEDPFMACFPELLDIGIMGHCKHGQSGLCLEAGVECYQDGLHARAPNMTLEDFQEIVRQCRGNTYQIALGGCGDPDQHEHFAEILDACRSAGIVPNFTTSGLGLNSELACGCDHGYKIGFDSCTVPGLIAQSVDINLASVDTCEGARWPAYITPDMAMLPCSFDNQARRWAVDLKTHTIQEAWDSSVFEDFRRHFRQSCPDCEHRLACMGGCPICPEIVLCQNRST